MEPGGASVKTLPNWLDLPRDLTIQIFIKIGVVDLLCSAQSVCSSWRAIAIDPRLYRVSDMHDPCKRIKDKSYKNYNLLLKLATEAFDRSCGQAMEFSIGGPDYSMKRDILYKTPGLKCLRLARSCCYVLDGCMIQVIPKLPLLEEVEFCLCFSKEVLQVLGCSCPKLKSLRLSNNCKYSHSLGHFKKNAFAIARNMNPCLQSLHLVGNLMKNTCLKAILDRLSQLDYLDLRQCFKLDLKGDLLKRCQGIKTLRLPNDSIEDHQFQVGERCYD